jgi:predicted alpha/beta-fold hydrolase
MPNNTKTSIMSACAPIADDKRQTKQIHQSSFKPSWWATNRHIQTIYPRFFQKRVKIDVRHERLPLPDGDFVNLAWVGDAKKARGLIVMFHGLEGSIKSHYANDMAANLQQQGYLVVLMHFRGCGGEQNLLPRAYHSGETEDPWYVINWLEQKFPDLPKVAMGFSLGANMLLKLLGEQPQQTILSGAIAISPPFRLEQCALSINQGFARLYQAYLLKSMVNNLLTKMQSVNYAGLLKINRAEAKALKSFREFDEHVTATLHGFTGANDYYQRSSAVHFMHKIQTPTLVLHAKDDPFMNAQVMPNEDELSHHVRLELSDKGGHVGFMQGTPWRPVIWTHRRVNGFLADMLTKKKCNKELTK